MGSPYRVSAKPKSPDDLEKALETFRLGAKGYFTPDHLARLLPTWADAGYELHAEVRRDDKNGDHYLLIDAIQGLGLDCHYVVLSRRRLPLDTLETYPSLGLALRQVLQDAERDLGGHDEWEAFLPWSERSGA